MFSVNTNLGAMAALQSLNKTQSELTTTQSHISTGKKVANASDDAATYAIGVKMQADLAGLSAVSDGLAFGQSVLGTASKATENIASQLDTLKGTVTNTLNQGLDPTQLANQIKQITSNIDEFSKSATQNGVNLLVSGGGYGQTANQLNVATDITGHTMQIGNQNLTSAALGLANLSTAANGGTELTFKTGFAIANHDTITLGDGTNSFTFEFTDGSAPLSATPSTTNKVFAVVQDPATSSVPQMLGALITTMRQAGFSAALNDNGTIDVAGQGIKNANTALTGAAAFTGNVTNTALTTGQAQLATVNSAVQTVASASAALGQAEKQVSAFQDFSSSLNDGLTSGLGALTDADMAAESAKLQSLQTKQQLAIQSLSMANQQPQALLKLFG